MSTAFRIGIFVFVALLFLGMGAFVIGDKDLLFRHTYILKADFQNVAGLNNGAEVRIGGIHQGTVKEIDLPQQPDGKVTVVMNLRSPTRSLIKKDSRASIETEGLLGDKYVEISFGSPKAEDVQNGDTIASNAPPDITAQAQALATEAREGIGAFRDDMEALQHNFFLRGFFERRGYSDTKELTSNSISHVPEGAPAKEFTYDSNQMFDKLTAKLKDERALDEAGKYLQANPFGLAVISAVEAKGYTDQAKVLTEARAKVVRDYLTQNFKIENDKRLRTIGLGKPKGSDESSKLTILVYPVISAQQQPAQGSQ